MVNPRKNFQEKIDEIGKDPRKFFRGCARKKRFPSRRAALGVARAMHDSRIRAYKCVFCKRWHLGHQ